MTKTIEKQNGAGVESAARFDHKKEPQVIVHASPVRYETISQRAYELYVERGCAHGYHIEDWLEAERQLVEEFIA